MDIITSSIINAAESSIPKSGERLTKPVVPWWSEEVRNAIREKKKALNRFKRSPTQENMITFKRIRSKCRRTILSSKRTSWENYVSGLTSQTPDSEIWRKIRAIQGKKCSTPLLILIDGQLHTDQEEVANELASYFESMSSSDNYKPEFLEIKGELETELNFEETEPASYNSLFSMTEFEGIYGIYHIYGNIYGILSRCR